MFSIAFWVAECYMRKDGTFPLIFLGISFGPLITNKLQKLEDALREMGETVDTGERGTQD